LALAALEADHGLGLVAPVIRHQHLHRKEIMAVQEMAVMRAVAAGVLVEWERLLPLTLAAAVA
jgi:hypothetical protein